MSITRTDVIPICKQIASEYEGWVYTSGSFKNKSLKHSIISIEPLWAYQLAAQPHVWLTNKKVNKLFQECLGIKNAVSSKIILGPDAQSETQSYFEFVYTLEDAEVYIRDFFQRGLTVIKQYYDYTDEAELLNNMPVGLKDVWGIAYCLSRVVLHDFKGANHFMSDKVKSEPDARWNDSVLNYLKIWEERYAETGSVFAKRKK